MMDAIVLYPYLLFRHGSDRIPETLYRHELEHFYQAQRDGVLRFYVRWLWYTIKHGYWDNPYEIEARQQAVASPLTEKERLWWAHAAEKDGSR
jgi:hypothetical protein